jgi:hypothetical protein
MDGLVPGEPLTLTLQFGGSSGYGFMGIEQRRQAMRELVEAGGSFEKGGFYVRPDGKRQWGLNTVWEQVFGERMKYPRARYQLPVVADPKRFNWLPVDGADGVDHKFLGAFSERGVWVENVKLRPGATWSSADAKARRLLTVLSGEGECGGEAISYLDTIQAEAGESLELTAGAASMELVLIGLPPVVLPATESQEYDVEELPAEDREPIGQQS